MSSSDEKEAAKRAEERSLWTMRRASAKALGQEHAGELQKGEGIQNGQSTASTAKSSRDLRGQIAHREESRSPSR